jgi:hypothetical protein
MLLVVEGVNGKDRSQLIRAGTLSQVSPPFQDIGPSLSVEQLVFKCLLQMQHTMLVMKQLVLLHGVESDVKVSSVIDETAQEELQNDEMITARPVSWKMDIESEIKPRALDDSSGVRATQVSQLKILCLLQQQLFP